MKTNIALMCHAPIVIPEIAEERAKDCLASTEAMELASKHLLSNRPEFVVVISPHTPRFEEAFGLLTSTQLRGDFSRFGHPELSYTFEGSSELTQSFMTFASKKDLLVSALPNRSLDHGALVPLHFLSRAGWKGPTLVFSLRATEDAEQTLKLGSCLKEFFSEKRFSLLVSGDMSHALSSDAPCPYHPRAKDFDLNFVRDIQNQNIQSLIFPEEVLRESACEDVVDSCRVAWGFRGNEKLAFELISYEAPFGVGYCIAKL